MLATLLPPVSLNVAVTITESDVYHPPFPKVPVVTSRLHDGLVLSILDTVAVQLPVFPEPVFTYPVTDPFAVNVFVLVLLNVDPSHEYEAIPLPPVFVPSIVSVTLPFVHPVVLFEIVQDGVAVSTFAEYVATELDFPAPLVT